MTTELPDTLHDDLAAHLSQLGGDARAHDGSDCPDAYRVERVLKRSDVETTELVWLRRVDGGELGPYVRKRIASGSGLGGAYRELAEAQRRGVRLAHVPHLVECRDEDGVLTVVMEHVFGAILREVIEQAAPVQRAELAARLMPALCEAVSELHEALERPIIHRDLTPDNIICPEARPLEPVLIDLGIARAWRAQALADTTHFGTRAYAPPEQYGFGQTDVRSDVYALGLIAFFCLTGRDPGARDRECGYDVPEVPEAWCRVVAHACALDPARRYGSARELGNACRVAAGDRVADGASRGESSRASSWQQPSMPLETTGHGEAVAGGRLGDVAAAARELWQRYEGKPVRLWNVRNVIVVVLTGLCMLVISAASFNPARPLVGPIWYDLYIGLVFCNAMFLLAGWFAFDKRWLRAHVNFFQSRTRMQAMKPILLGFLALFVLTFVVAFLANT